MRAAEPNARHCAKWRRATGLPATCTMLALPYPWRGQLRHDPGITLAMTLAVTLAVTLA